ncbi:MAG: hypothetical protein ACSLEL_04250 [Candidatus Malihini olakiniferum]
MRWKACAQRAYTNIKDYYKDALDKNAEKSLYFFDLPSRIHLTEEVFTSAKN